MTQQLQLSYSDPRIGRSRKHDCVTAKDAAKTAAVSRQRDVLLRELRSTSVGRTPDELEDATGIKSHVAASRLSQMRRDRLCEPFGTRQGKSGRSQQIWFALAAPAAVDVPTGGRL